MKFRTSRQFLARLASRRATRLVAIALAGSYPLLASTTRAANYYWDGGTTSITGNGDGVSQGGGGTWDKTITNWDVGSGVAHAVWADGNTAIFGSTGGTVTLSTPISALNLQFTGTGYSVGPTATNTLTLTGGFGTAGAGATIYSSGAGINTISGPLTIAATGSSTPAYFSAAAGSTLTLSGTITQTTPNTSGNNIGGGGTVNYTGTGFATGKFTVVGGITFNTSGTMTGFTQTYATVADTVTGTSWNVTGGTVTAPNTTTLLVGNGAGTSGTFTVSGGSTANFGALNAGSSFNGTNDSTGTVTVGGATGGLLNVTGAVRLGSNGAGVGTLNLNANGRMVIGSAAGTIARNTGATATGGSGNLNFNGGILQYNAAPNTPAIAASITTTILEGGGTINTNNLAVTIASPILHGGTAAVDGGLTKVNGGTLTLNGVNTYTGATMIGAGTIAFGNTAAQTISGNISGAGAISQIGSGATTITGTNSYSAGTTIGAGTIITNNAAALGGSTAGQVAINSGGTLNVGDVGGTPTIGALTLGSGTTTPALVLSSGGVLTLTLNNAGGSDTITLTGTANLAGTLALNTTDSINYGAAYNLFSGSSTVNSTGLSFTGYDTNYTPSLSNVGVLSFAPVPEPATWAAGALLLGVAGWQTRRRPLRCVA